jgi:N-acetylmuramic acid 6-phosphate etherase
MNKKNTVQNRAQREAENFLKNEKQFHLGILPTEQSNPKTRGLDKKFEADPAEGLRALLSVDADIVGMAEKIFHSWQYEKMINDVETAVRKGNKVVFSGCGSTGRLSILLESVWRRFFINLHRSAPELYYRTRKYEDSVYSIMTGGDYALIRSVESFEDYQEFGRQQARELNIVKGDVLVAITEGGETSSVLGTVAEAADRGAGVFLLFNNPAEILVNNIERSKRAIEDPRVTVLDLYCCPMAIAGSTRMQATTSELLVAGAALETVLLNILNDFSDSSSGQKGQGSCNYPEAFNHLLAELNSASNLKSLADYIKLEVAVYKEKGLVTYFANDHMIDIFTDTTERAPTFMLPPFTKIDDKISPPSWAFAKNPLFSTPKAWNSMLCRQPRCLKWDSALYRKMNAPQVLVDNPPLLDRDQILKFCIGNEPDNSRLSRTPNVAVNILGSNEINGEYFEEYRAASDECASAFQRSYSLVIGAGDYQTDFKIDYPVNETPLRLFRHLAFKLVLNTISTATMVLMGRVTGNWMSWVDVSNKKLKDRAVRLIGDICRISYEDACYELHEALEELKTITSAEEERLSPVQYTIKKIREKRS